jgi:tetratricopeptide (TPR) repeat protein
MSNVYDLYTRGSELLAHGDYQAATVPLSRARDLEPDKTSIREALGRALFHSQRYEEAATEFGAIADRAPTNDYALFCLGRAMQLLGRHREACHPLALACSLRPDRQEYRVYRDRARRLAGTAPA